MTENFNREYRRLAEAAEEVATDKNRRKRSGFASPDYVEKVGRSPKILRSNASRKFQEEFSDDTVGETLSSFLKILGGNTDADAQHMLSIGNFLHDHRTELEKNGRPPNQPLSPEDRRLMDLACVLIENSFYRGDFLGISKQQRASLAFTVNVIAKIFEYPKSREGLKGFDREKLKQFIDAVHRFEQESLFPGVVPEKGADSARGRALEIFQTEIDRKKREPGTTRSDIEVLVQKCEYMRLADRAFLDGEMRGRGLMKEPYVLAYLFKHVLIVQDEVESGKDEKERDLLEAGLAIGRLPAEWEEKREGSISEHLMLPHINTHGNYYANLHFFVANVPFAVWALRYLRSQKRQKRPEIHSI